MAAAPLTSTPASLDRPLLGHLPAFRRERLELLDACAGAPGDVVELRIGRPTYLLKRAEDVRHVFVVRRDAYAKSARDVGPRATRIFGDGLLTSSEAAHRPERRRMQPAFRRESVARAGERIVRGVDAAADRWQAAGQIELAAEMTALSLRTTIASILGVESGPDLEALEAGIVARRHAMTRAFNSFAMLPGFLPIAVRPEDRRAVRASDAALERAVAAADDDDDLLPAMMGTDGAQDPERAREHALTAVMAAYENVGRALTWTLLALARHPDVEARLLDEVDRVLGDRPPTADDYGALRYLGMTLSESLRLWPPNPFVIRVAREDDELPTGTRVGAGSKVILSPYVLQREPLYWPDPERFDPERFGDEARRGRPRFAYFPFGGGPRVCIGQTLANLQCTLVLARIAQRTRLELVADAPGYVCGCLPPGFGPAMRAGAPTPAARL